jgi:protein-S-isoprenylcysteine O-methyltransferase Ste14
MTPIKAKQMNVIVWLRESIRMKRSALFFILVPLIAIAFVLVNFAHPPWTPVRILGLLITLAAGTALTVARLQLGNSFSIRPEAHELVTRGIYSKIRNPVYVFGAFLVAGLLLYLDQLRWLWILLLLIPIQLLRARAESRVLEDRFGDDYRRYRASTWF